MSAVAAVLFALETSGFRLGHTQSLLALADLLHQTGTPVRLGASCVVVEVRPHSLPVGLEVTMLVAALVAVALRAATSTALVLAAQMVAVLVALFMGLMTTAGFR
jgi:hypothetical protein